MFPAIDDSGPEVFASCGEHFLMNLWPTDPERSAILKLTEEEFLVAQVMLQ